MIIMKKAAQVFLVLFAFVTVFSFTSCDEETREEKVDKIENSAKEIGGEIEEVGDEIVDEIDDATDDK